MLAPNRLGNSPIRRRENGRLLLTAAVMLLLVAAGRSPAIVLNDTTVGAINNTAPGDDRGWQYVASWRSSSAVAIGPHAFLTARHIGDSGNTVVQNDGNTYTVKALHDMDDPGNEHDFRIVEVNETVAHYAPLWSGGTETGKLASLIGRGRVRDATPIDEDPGAGANGWLSSYGNAQVMSWGMNTTDAVVTVASAYGNERALRFDFDAPGSPGEVTDEGIYTRGDSGGGMFLYNSTEGQWQLAGLNAYLYPPPPDLFRDEGGGVYTNILPDTDDRLAIYSTTGLFVEQGAGYVAAGANDISKGLALQLSYQPYAEFMADYVPEPASVCLLALGAAGVLVRRRRRRR